MRKTFWQQRIPSLLGFFILLFAIGITSYLSGNNAIFLIRANPSNSPQNIKITNITDTSFTVSYITADKVSGIVLIGNEKESKTTVQDDKDKESKTIGGSYKTHHITVKNLKPKTSYSFSIISGADTFLNKENLFEVKTTSLINTLSDERKISGKVLLSDGSSPQEGIVYLNTDNSQTLSTVIDQNGNYFFDLSSLRDQKLETYISLNSTSSFSLYLTNGQEESNAKIVLDKIESIPVIHLSQNYDFETNDNLNNNSNESSKSAEITGFPLTSTQNSAKTTQILSPKMNEEFIDQKPLFKGTASPGATIDITIHSNEQIQTQINADSNGNWNYRPKDSLTPGEHTITISTYDQSGILKKITQSFTVYASGTQVSESATPSATPIISPSLTPTSIPTSIPTLTSTPIPIFTPIPTPTSILVSVTATMEAPGNSSMIQLGTTATLVATLGIIISLLAKAFLF